MKLKKILREIQSLTLLTGVFILLMASVSSSSAQINPPYNLTATAISSSIINLAWNIDSASNIAGFEIHRKIEGSNNFIFIATVGFNQTTYQNINLLPNTLYYYKVRTLGPDSTFSAFSNIASARTFPDTIHNEIPNAPSNLVAVAVSPTRIRLHWNDNSNNESGFKIFRGILDSAIIWSLIATVVPNTTTYYDEGLTPNTIYYYRLYAYNSYGNSPFSNTSSARTSTDTGSISPPNGATGVSLTPLLTWGGVFDALTSYTLEMATDEDFNSTVLSQNNIQQPQYQVQSGILGNATRYYWRVRAFLGSGINFYLGQWSFSTGLVSVTPVSSKIPDKFSLYQNYPNPFNPVTKIKFDLPSANNVRIEVYDILGRAVATLVNQYLKAGSYEVDFNASGYSSGVYFCKLQTGGFVDTKKMIINK
jgi:hypothetical protein